MEPGLLCRYKWSDLTYFHGQAELRFPIAGDPIYSGPALTWGIGVSHVWYETDTVAFIPTLEFINIWILDGQVTPFPGGLPVDVKGDGIFNLARDSAPPGTPAAIWASSSSASARSSSSAPTAGTTPCCGSTCGLCFEPTASLQNFRWLVLSAVGKVAGDRLVTLPVAAHSQPRMKVMMKPTHSCESLPWPIGV